MPSNRKNIMKSIAVSFAAVCLLLTGCGSKSPEVALIEEDMRTQMINDYGPGFSLESYEIVQSITNDNVYSATIEANANGTYVDLSFSADIQYTKYDQGWQSDYIFLCMNSYELTNYPNEDEIRKLHDNRNNRSDWDVNYSVTEFESEYVISTGEIHSQYNEYFTLCGDVTTCWTYDFETDSWIIDSEYKDYYGTLNFNVEGKWRQYDDSDYIRVKNQTETGMDVCVEGLDNLGDEWVHVELCYDEDIMLQDNGLTVVYKGFSSESKELTVTFFMSHYNELGISAEIPGWFNSRHGYYRDYISG